MTLRKESNNIFYIRPMEIINTINLMFRKKRSLKLNFNNIISQKEIESVLKEINLITEDSKLSILKCICFKLPHLRKTSGMKLFNNLQGVVQKTNLIQLNLWYTEIHMDDFIIFIDTIKESRSLKFVSVHNVRIIEVFEVAPPRKTNLNSEVYLKLFSVLTENSNILFYSLKEIDYVLKIKNKPTLDSKDLINNNNIVIEENKNKSNPESYKLSRYLNKKRIDRLNKLEKKDNLDINDKISSCDKLTVETKLDTQPIEINIIKNQNQKISNKVNEIKDEKTKNKSTLKESKIPQKININLIDDFRKNDNDKAVINTKIDKMNKYENYKRDKQDRFENRHKEKYDRSVKKERDKLRRIEEKKKKRTTINPNEVIDLDLIEETSSYDAKETLSSTEFTENSEMTDSINVKSKLNKRLLLKSRIIHEDYLVNRKSLKKEVVKGYFKKFKKKTKESSKSKVLNSDFNDKKLEENNKISNNINKISPEKKIVPISYTKKIKTQLKEQTVNKSVNKIKINLLNLNKKFLLFLSNYMIKFENLISLNIQNCFISKFGYKEISCYLIRTKSLRVFELIINDMISLKYVLKAIKLNETIFSFNFKLIPTILGKYNDLKNGIKEILIDKKTILVEFEINQFFNLQLVTLIKCFSRNHKELVRRIYNENSSFAQFFIFRNIEESELSYCRELNRSLQEYNCV